ncbi:hypothetical protein PC116_g29298 [Phytophthora cactorum]|nr:hypothetical protein PC116_g29298 [Phytophthora cactorum]
MDVLDTDCGWHFGCELGNKVHWGIGCITREQVSQDYDGMGKLDSAVW